MVQTVDAGRFEWWDQDPGRLERDQREVHARFPYLSWSASGNGQWAGELPMWPFERDCPPGLERVLNGQGLRVEVHCGQAYPAAPPRVWPIAPEPEIVERTQHKWHVNGDGTLCLFENESTWSARASMVDLMLKAAGWRIEYALMKAGHIETMTPNGIVSDPRLDQVIMALSATMR